MLMSTEHMPTPILVQAFPWATTQLILMAPQEKDIMSLSLLVKKPKYRDFIAVAELTALLQTSWSL